METRFLTNVTLIDKAYHLDPPVEFVICVDPTIGDGHICATNETLSILEYGRNVKDAMNEVKESFERRCRFYADSQVVLTGAQEEMKTVYEALNLEEGHIVELPLVELGQIEEPLAVKPSVVEVNDSYHKAYTDGYRDAVKTWELVVHKLIDKLN